MDKYVIPFTNNHVGVWRFLHSEIFPPGIIARDGHNISFSDLSAQIRTTYNFSPSFCLFVPRRIATILNRSYKTGRFDLSDIDVHNGIEHDASLVRKCQTTISLALPLPCPPPLGLRANLTSLDRA